MQVHCGGPPGENLGARGMKGLTPMGHRSRQVIESVTLIKPAYAYVHIDLSRMLAIFSAYRILGKHKAA
jgi:hypothetical protein